MNAKLNGANLNRTFATICIVTASAALLLSPHAARADGEILGATAVGRYRLQSNPWVNLHQRLLEAAQFDAPSPAGMTGDALQQWKKAVQTYRAHFGKRNPIFDPELTRLNDELSANAAHNLPAAIAGTAASTLREIMPAYRAAQWPHDDRANRFWISVAVPLLASAGEELAEAHAKAYAAPFPRHILVDVAASAWQFGAYTVGEGDHAHVVIASVVPGNQGFGALEMLMHEPSHAIVDATTGAIGGDLTQLSKSLGVRPPPSLWHAILFYTSGELTRRALAQRGVTDYRPVISEMYGGPFRGFQTPLETHWQAFLDGKMTRDDALRQILIETGTKR